jgi:hypothetical protein
MHIISLLHIASFQLLAYAATNPSHPPNPWKKPSSPIWETLKDDNESPYFFETGFEEMTGFTAYSMAKDLSSRLERCFVNLDFDRPRKLVLSPANLGPNPKATWGYRDAITRAVTPDGLHTLDKMFKLCKLGKDYYIPKDAVTKMQAVAASGQPQNSEVKINSNLYNWIEWTFEKCLTLAWGMLAEEGSIAIESPLGKATEVDDYLGELLGLKHGLRIPAYSMEEDEISADIPKYTRIKDLWYTRQEKYSGTIKTTSA